jgi:hypothetical protein
VLGCVATLLLSPNVLSKKLTIHAKQTKGVQDTTEYSNDAGTADEKCELKTKVGGALEEGSGELSEGEIENFEQGGKAVEALVMTA